MVTLPSSWSNWVSDGSVSVYCDWVRWNSYLSVAARKTCLGRSVPEIHQHVAVTATHCGQIRPWWCISGTDLARMSCCSRNMLVYLRDGSAQHVTGTATHCGQIRPWDTPACCWESNSLWGDPSLRYTSMLLGRQLIAGHIQDYS